MIYEAVEDVVMMNVCTVISKKILMKILFCQKILCYIRHISTSCLYYFHSEPLYLGTDTANLLQTANQLTKCAIRTTHYSLYNS